jgi:hypothetical protein
VFAACICNQWRNCGFTGGKIIIHTAPRNNDTFQKRPRRAMSFALLKPRVRASVNTKEYTSAISSGISLFFTFKTILHFCHGLLRVNFFGTHDTIPVSKIHSRCFGIIGSHGNFALIW